MPFRPLAILPLFACSTDVSILKRYEPPQDTAEIDTEDTNIEDTNSTDDTEDSGQSVDPNVDESLVVGYLHYYLTQIACPACVGSAQEITLSMTMATHYPITDSYFDNFKPQGTCTTVLYNTYVSATPLSYGNTVSVNPVSGGTPITLTETATGSYTSPPMLEYQYARDTYHNILFQNGDSVPNAFMSARGFDTIEPYTMLWVDPSYAFDAPIYRSGATFSWGPSGSTGDFVVQIDVYTPDGSQYLSSVECWGADSGSLTVPATYLSSFQSGSLALIHLIRHQTGEFVYPDVGTIETHMQWEVIGTGYIQ